MRHRRSWHAMARVPLHCTLFSSIETSSRAYYNAMARVPSRASGGEHRPRIKQAILSAEHRRDRLIGEAHEACGSLPEAIQSAGVREQPDMEVHPPHAGNRMTAFRRCGPHPHQKLARSIENFLLVENHLQAPVVAWSSLDA